MNDIDSPKSELGTSVLLDPGADRRILVCNGVTSTETPGPNITPGVNLPPQTVAITDRPAPGGSALRHPSQKSPTPGSGDWKTR